MDMHVFEHICASVGLQRRGDSARCPHRQEAWCAHHVPGSWHVVVRSSSDGLSAAQAQPHGQELQELQSACECGSEAHPRLFCA